MGGGGCRDVGIKEGPRARVERHSEVVVVVGGGGVRGRKGGGCRDVGIKEGPRARVERH